MSSFSNEVPESLQPFRTVKLFHKTWAGTFACRPQATFQPRNLAEIQELIKQARLHKKTIMTVGSGHSPSDLTMTKEWLCNLDHFNRVLHQQEFSGPKSDIDTTSITKDETSITKDDTSDKKTSDDQEVKFVDLTIEAGCRIFQLNDYLKQHNLAIQNLGSISDQSMAGIISTGTHGSSKNHGLVSQQVVSIDILNSQGELITCNSVTNPDIFRAALLSLGKIGIIVHVTLRAVPRYTIKSKQETIFFDTLIRDWDTIWLESEFNRIWWFPYSRKCIVWRAVKSDEPLSDPRPSWYGTTLGRFFYQSLLFISVHFWPRLTPFVEKFVFKQQYGSVETLGKGDIAVQNSVEGLNMDCLFSQFVNEWSAPLKTGQDTLIKLDDAIQKAAASGEFFVHAPIEVRCSNVTNSDTAFVEDGAEPDSKSLYPPQSWLATRNRLSAGPVPGNNFRPYLDNSPEDLPYQSDPSKITNDQLSMFINATMYRPFHTNVETKEWFQAFEHIMSEAKGRPHWAKNFIGVKGDHATKQDLESQLNYGGKEFYTMIGFHPVMQSWFGDRLVKFNEVRKRMDPDGVFLSGKDWAVRNGLLLD